MRFTSAILGLGIFLLSACASSPEPRRYALTPGAGVRLNGAPLKVEVRRVSLPRYLDRQALVRRIGSAQLELYHQDLWGAPLDEMVSETLAENLALRLPGSSVFTDEGAIHSKPDVHVEAELQRFELTEEGVVRLDAEVAVQFEDPRRDDLLDRYGLSLRSSGDAPADVVREMSSLLARLSDAIARSIAPAAGRPGQAR